MLELPMGEEMNALIVGIRNAESFAPQIMTHFSFPKMESAPSAALILFPTEDDSRLTMTMKMSQFVGYYATIATQ